MTKSSKKDLSNLDQVKFTQQQLIQSEKMASLGTIAAGVAHEINNPLSFLLSNLQTLKTYLAHIYSVLDEYAKLDSVIGKKPAEISVDHIQTLLKNIQDLKTKKEINYIINDTNDLLEESLSGVVRIRDIVQSLKTFSRSNYEKPVETDVNECLRAALKVASNELKYKCEVKTDFDNLPKIINNPGHLLQIFMNLLINSAQAIETRGIVTVESKLLANQLIQIKISDTGSGISPENMSKLFTPFFSTKPVGVGTGLGLSVSYGLIQNMGGTISVESKLNQGTTFIIQLPKTPPKEESNDI